MIASCTIMLSISPKWHPSSQGKPTAPCPSLPSLPPFLSQPLITLTFLRSNKTKKIGSQEGSRSKKHSQPLPSSQPNYPNNSSPSPQSKPWPQSSSTTLTATPSSALPCPSQTPGAPSPLSSPSLLSPSLLLRLHLQLLQDCWRFCRRLQYSLLCRWQRLVGQAERGLWALREGCRPRSRMWCRSVSLLPCLGR